MMPLGLVPRRGAPSRSVGRRALFGAAGGALCIAAAAALIVRSRPRHGRPPPECQIGPTTPGIDVSYYQETIDWPRVQRAGIRFAFIRLADGLTQRDAMFATNWIESRRAGLARGAYLFFRPDQDVAAQADLMIAAMRGSDHDDLPPVIDVEVDGGLTQRDAMFATNWIESRRARSE